MTNAAVVELLKEQMADAEQVHREVLAETADDIAKGKAAEKKLNEAKRRIFEIQGAINDLEAADRKREEPA